MTTHSPIGTTRVRGDGCRYIKVSSTGPRKKQWSQYARWVWETFKGPIPSGKRVLHKDGDVTNDDIRNLMLGTPADALWIYCHRDPKKSGRNYRKCATATAKSNRLRGVINRQRNWLPTRWYAVNVQLQRAWNNPKKLLCDLAVELGIEFGDRKSGRKIWAAILGYPQGSKAQAVVVQCLTTELLTMAALHARVMEFERRLGWKPMRVTQLRSVLSELRQAGTVTGPRGRYQLTIEPPRPLAIVRGSFIIKHLQRCCRVDSVQDLLL